MVMGKDGHKLSKRLGSTSVRDFRAQGYLPDALLNCIAMVGWSYDGERELFTLKELEELFDIEKLNKAPGVFDYQKLEWFNGMYIRAKSRQELAGLIAPFMKAAGLPGDDGTLLEGVAGLVQERVKVLSEVPGMVRFIFEEPPAPAPEDLLPKKGDAAAAVAALRRLDALLPELAAEDAAGSGGAPARACGGAGREARGPADAAAGGGDRLEGLPAAGGEHPCHGRGNGAQARRHAR